MTPFPSLPTATDASDRTGDRIGLREHDDGSYYYWPERPLDRLNAALQLGFIDDWRSADTPRSWNVDRVVAVRSNSATQPESPIAGLQRVIGAIRSVDRSVLDPSLKDLAEKALRSLQDRGDEDAQEWAARMAEGIRGVND